MTHRKVSHFSFKDVCIELFGDSPLLTERINSSEIDCMGKVASIQQFCLKKPMNPLPLTRAIMASDGEVVFCEYGSTVKVKVPCGNHVISDFCERKDSPTIACGKLQKIYANNLNLIHHSTPIEKGKLNLSCYFAMDNKDLI